MASSPSRTKSRLFLALAAKNLTREGMRRACLALMILKERFASKP